LPKKLLEDAVFYKKAVARGLWETREEWDLKDTRTFDNPKETLLRYLLYLRLRLP
jgi:hypothetical protein